MSEEKAKIHPTKPPRPKNSHSMLLSRPEEPQVQEKAKGVRPTQSTETPGLSVNAGQGFVQRDPRESTSLTAQDIKAQVHLIQEVMQAVMREGYHYGTIPGTDKPTLLKPGAEKLTMTFRLAPLLRVRARDLDNGHREYRVRCTLVHIPTGHVYGEGVGLCSTLESRYRYRYADRICPQCARATIIKGKPEYGGGWLCFQRKGGCGAKFGAQDASIISQEAGRMENRDLADTYNTVLKIAKKRALIDATLTATAASDIFTQDLEDSTTVSAESPKPETSLVQAAVSVPAPLSPTTASSGGGTALNQKLLELVLLAQRRSKVVEADFKGYLATTYGITDPKELRQADFTRVLEWLAQQPSKRQPADELL
jgi:hypothetical protein